MQDRAFANPKIDFRWNAVVDDVVGDGKVEALRAARHASPATTSTLAVDGLFVAIGHDPNTEALRGPARARRERLRRHRAPTPPVRRSTACSRPATCRTTCSARRSPPPAPAAWPRSRPSAGSRPEHDATAGVPSADAAPRSPDTGNLRTASWLHGSSGTLRIARRRRPTERNSRGEEHPHPLRLHLRRDHRWRGHPGARRLLGRVVRPVPDDRPDARGDRRRARGQAADRQAQRRRQPRHGDALQRDEHPDAARVPAPATRQVKRLVGAKGKGQLLQDLAEFVA